MLPVGMLTSFINSILCRLLQASAGSCRLVQGRADRVREYNGLVLSTRQHLAVHLLDRPFFLCSSEMFPEPWGASVICGGGFYNLHNQLSDISRRHRGSPVQYDPVASDGSSFWGLSPHGFILGIFKHSKIWCKLGCMVIANLT